MLLNYENGCQVQIQTDKKKNVIWNEQGVILSYVRAPFEMFALVFQSQVSVISESLDSNGLQKNTNTGKHKNVKFIFLLQFVMRSCSTNET